ncbi:MAG: DUF2818 family protein [Sulfuriferula sp.]|nr:DUF2818 family protein [Sulfuriferula sp.]
MNAAIIALLLLALIAANLPFFSERIGFVMTPKSGSKAFIWRVLELVALYFVTGLIGHLLEQKSGTPQQQHWEFYAVTASMFIVLAFPGFVYRFLWRRGA